MSLKGHINTNFRYRGVRRSVGGGAAGYLPQLLISSHGSAPSSGSGGYFDELTGESFDRRSLLGIRLRVYSPEKTLADCFKYRNKLGLDMVLEALRLYRSRKRPNVGELMKFARVCRVEKVMRPYLEALL